MKYSDLLKEIENYDANKGFWRRWFWDSPYIKVMRDFMHKAAMEHSNSETILNLDLKYHDFERFAQNTIPVLDILKHLEKHKTLSGMILFKWFGKDLLAIPAVYSQINYSATSAILQELMGPSLGTFSIRETELSLPRVSMIPPLNLQYGDLSIPSHERLSNMLSNFRNPPSPQPQSNGYIMGYSLFFDPSARFFVDEEGVIHDNLAPSPHASPTFFTPINTRSRLSTTEPVVMPPTQCAPAA